MRLMTIVGARPQFVKAATVSRAIACDFPQIKEILVHTGQHYDANMSDVFFHEMGIPQPHYHLGVGGGSHGQNTGRMLEKLDKLITQERPDGVLVYGDTDSTLAGSLAAAKLHVPVAHVEAGLRSFNRQMPEEINRILTDHIADLLFVPTQNARHNLLREGLVDEKIHVVGDVMYDAALYYQGKARQPSWVASQGLDSFILCTIHRAENTDNPIRMRSILAGLAEAKIPVVLPMHPRTHKQISHFGLILPNTVHVVAPVGYLEMVWLESHCELILTDSGGVQKEAYFHGKPCVTLRDETEWVELVEIGANSLVGADINRIQSAIHNFQALDKNQTDIFGSGDSAKKILRLLESGLS